MEITKSKRHKARSVRKSRSQQAIAGQPALSLRQTEERLIKEILGGVLALYLLRNSTIPVSELLEGLTQIESEVGQFVGQTIKTHTESLKQTGFQGLLAGVLSFIHHDPLEGVPKPPSRARKTVASPKGRSKPMQK